MTRLRIFLKNSARPALLQVKLILAACLLSGCISSGAPSYPKEAIDQAIHDICKKEYSLDVTARLVGETLWIYLPIEDIFEKSDKPEKYTERFSIEENKGGFDNETLKIDYLVKPVPEQEKSQEIKYSKAAMDKINNTWKVLRRVLFSMEHSEKGNPKFVYLINADIKNGFEIRELLNIEDLKKVSYNFISWGEYQHRTIQDTDVSAAIIGDQSGQHVAYKDVSWEEFLIKQIEHRIKLKFQKPEVARNADIDKEIIKVVVATLKIYGFKDFSSVELLNLMTNNKTMLNQAAIWARPTE